MPDTDPELEELGENYKRNREYAKPGSYTTKLSPLQEKEFQGWLYKNNVNYDMHWPPDQSQQTYDMRGFWKAQKAGDPRAKTTIDPSDKKVHYPDIWKTPYHESFSKDSVYATKDAPEWKGNKLYDKEGKLLKDATPYNEQIKAGQSGPGYGRFGGDPVVDATGMPKSLSEPGGNDRYMQEGPLRQFEATGEGTVEERIPREEERSYPPSGDPVLRETPSYLPGRDPIRSDIDYSGMIVPPRRPAPSNQPMNMLISDGAGLSGLPEAGSVAPGGRALETPASPPLPLTTGPVAAGLPAHARTFLDTIAGPESTKQYDVRYAPGRQGETPFSEGPEHPNIAEPTARGKTSTAAGRYQITKQTWDEYSRRYPDLTEGGFTRENQDKVAWQLAQNRYKAKVGRDLGTDLQWGRTGDVEPALIATWTGGAKGFADRYASQSKPILLAGGDSGLGALSPGVFGYDAYQSLPPVEGVNKLR